MSQLIIDYRGAGGAVELESIVYRGYMSQKFH